MLLSQLQPGQRFEFADKVTTVVYHCGKDLMQFPAHGAFRFVGVGTDSSPILTNADSTKRFEAISGTFNREVYILLQ